jgi:hypothetical protein
MAKLSCFFLIGIALLTVGAAQAMPPDKVELTFEIRFGMMKLGVGEDHLKHDGKTYQVNSDTIPKGIAALFIDDIRRESKGTITSNGLKPASFVERGRKNGIRAAQFDWAQHKLSMTAGDEKQTVDLPDGTIDQVSLPYAFAFASGVPEDFKVHVTDGRRLTEYRYRIVGRERIDSALGEIDTIHFEKVRDADDKRSFEFWVAVNQHYLPVQMRFKDKNGRQFDSVVTSISYP